MRMKLRTAVTRFHRAADRIRFYILGVTGGAISPAITGLFVQYTAVPWRGMLYLLAGLSATTLLLQLLFVPNTQHTPTPYAQARKLTARKWIFRLEAINPWACIRTLKNWRLAAIVSRKVSSHWTDEVRLYMPALRSTARSRCRCH